MSPHWLTEAHLDAVKETLAVVQHPVTKRYLRDVYLGLSQDYAQRKVAESAQEYMHEPVAPLMEGDLVALQALLSKGIQHNGVIPEVDAVQVARSMQIVAELVGRAELAALTHEDREGLDWVFDVAADVTEGLNRKAVRRLEQLVRGAMGLGLRYPPLGKDHEPMH